MSECFVKTPHVTFHHVNSGILKHATGTGNTEDVHLKQKSGKILSKLRNVETTLKALDEEVSEIKNTINRLLEMDNKMKSMEDELINHNNQINNLVKKFNDTEEKLKKKEISTEKTVGKIKCTLCKFEMKK